MLQVEILQNPSNAAISSVFHDFVLIMIMSMRWPLRHRNLHTTLHRLCPNALAISPKIV